MLFKKDKEKAKEKAGQKLENTADDVMQEVDEEAANEFVGGVGNPFANLPRANNQAIDSDLRNNG